MAKIWDLSSGQELVTLKGHADRLTSVAFRPDGQRIATGSADRAIKIWNPSTGQEVLTLRGHTQSVDCVAYSPDGENLSSAGSDHAVKVWQPDEALPDAEARRRQIAANGVSAWRLQEAADCEWNQQWFAAAFHLSLLLRDEPMNPSLYLRRAEAYTRLGQPDRAAADRAKAAESSKPKNSP